MSRLRNGLLGLCALGAAGCVSVNSSMPSTTTVTGESWYGENTSFLGMTFSSRVWYCPAPTGPGPLTCVEAKMVAEGETANVPGSACTVDCDEPRASRRKRKAKPVDADSSEQDAQPKKNADDADNEDAKPNKKKNTDEDEETKPKKKKPVDD